VRLALPLAAGSTTDVVARLIAQPLQHAFTAKRFTRAALDIRVKDQNCIWSAVMREANIQPH